MVLRNQTLFVKKRAQCVVKLSDEILVLRLLDTYASKIANICDLKTFWPLRV